jgi:MFS family permease
MTPRAVAALGIGQCVSWGVLYYAFAVLVLPLERELAVPTWVVTGAFSLALLMSAALAPAVGRWSDRGRGALVMQAGGVTAAALLVAWTAVPGVLALYAVWAALGLCMAATLYEPAFVIVARACRDARSRLRALAAVTLVGGLASTIFLPLTATLVDARGWRSAALVLAAALLAATGIVRVLAFQNLRAAAAEPARDAAAPRPDVTKADPAPLLFVTATFALASLASAAFTANLLPALGERGIPPVAAAMLGGLMGIMQLPGRALLLHGVFAASPSRLLAGSLGLQAAGFGGVAVASSPPVAAAGCAVFALGAGLMTLVRPHLVHTMFGTGREGYLNGRIARCQQLARAAGPLAVAWLGGVFGYTPVFAVIAGVFTAVAVASPGILGAGAPAPCAREREALLRGREQAGTCGPEAAP